MDAAAVPGWIVEAQASVGGAHGFTPEELAANRDGRIARSQFPTLLQFTGGLWRHFGAALQCAAWVGVAGYAFAERAPHVLIWMLGAALTAHLALNFRAVCTLLLLPFDWFEKRSRRLEGPLHTSTSYDNVEEPADAEEARQDPWNRVTRTVRREQYWYAIGDERLTVSLAALRALHPYSGSTCRVYVAARSGLLLSVELVKVKVSPYYRSVR